MIYIHGMGHFHPDNVIDNPFLESLDIGTTDQWIMDRVGIHRRRTVLPLDYIVETRNADPREGLRVASHDHQQCAVGAARMALGRAGLTAADVGLVIGGSSTIQLSSPTEGCAVAGLLGIDAPAFDVNSACTSFAAQLHVLEGMKLEALPDFILLTLPESNTLTVDYNDRNAAVLFGDAAAALVVSPRVSAPLRLRHSVLHSQPSSWERVIIPAMGHFCQDGPVVQRFAIRKTVATFKELEGSAGPGRRPPWFIGHQANMLMLQSSCAAAGIEEPQHLFNVDQFGNCGSAGAPSVLSCHWDMFEPGDRIVVALVGAGLTWGGVLLEMDGEAGS